jgi:hypothetical protein
MSCRICASRQTCFAICRTVMDALCMLSGTQRLYLTVKWNHKTQDSCTPNQRIFGSDDDDVSFDECHKQNRGIVNYLVALTLRKSFVTHCFFFMLNAATRSYCWSPVIPGTIMGAAATVDASAKSPPVSTQSSKNGAQPVCCEACKVTLGIFKRKVRANNICCGYNVISFSLLQTPNVKHVSHVQCNYCLQLNRMAICTQVMFQCRLPWVNPLHTLHMMNFSYTCMTCSKHTSLKHSVDNGWNDFSSTDTSKSVSWQVASEMLHWAVDKLLTNQQLVLWTIRRKTVH